MENVEGVAATTELAGAAAVVKHYFPSVNHKNRAMLHGHVRVLRDFVLCAMGNKKSSWQVARDLEQFLGPKAEEFVSSVESGTLDLGETSPTAEKNLEARRSRSRSHPRRADRRSRSRSRSRSGGGRGKENMSHSRSRSRSRRRDWASKSPDSGNYDPGRDSYGDGPDAARGRSRSADRRSPAVAQPKSAQGIESIESAFFSRRQRVPRDAESRMICIETNYQIGRCKDAAGLCTLIEHGAAKFDHICVATAFCKLLQLQGLPDGGGEEAELTLRSERETEREGGREGGVGGGERGSAARELQTLRTLEQLALKTMQDFECKQIASMFHTIAKFNYTPSDPRLVEALERQAEAEMTTFSAQGIANVLWAYAKIGRAGGNVPAHQLSARARAHSTWYQTHARQGPGAQLMRGLEARAEAIAFTFTAQEVSNTLWAYGQMGREPGEGLMRALDGRVGELARFDPQSWRVATSMLADFTKMQEEFETFKTEHEHLRRDLEVHGIEDGMPALGFESMLTENEDLKQQLSGWGGAWTGLDRELTARDVASILGAYAKVGREPGEEVMQALERRVEAVAGSFIAFEVDTVLLSYANLGQPPREELMQVLEGRVEVLVGTYTAQNVASTLWSYAMMGREPGAQLMRGLEGQAEATADAFQAIQVDQTLWAYVTMGREPGPGVMQVLERRAEALADTLLPHHFTNLLWAYATMGREPGTGLMRGLEARANTYAEEMTEVDLPKALWGLSVLAIRAPEKVVRMVQVLVDRLVALGSAACFTQVGLSQLHQFFLSCSLEEKLCVKALDGLGDLKEACRKSFVDNTLSTSRASGVQKDVSMTLRRMGFSVEDEFCCPKSGYSIDMLLHDSDLTIGGESNGGRRSWALEYDGPSHFYEARLPNGSTLLKRYHLQRLGYTLVSVPHWECGSLHSPFGCGLSEQEREEYLRGRLSDCCAGELPRFVLSAQLSAQEVLNERIMHCQAVDLDSLIWTRGTDFDHVNVATAICKSLEFLPVNQRTQRRLEELALP